jgi:16S rRNA (guanine527-N7)-methyltransferase
MHKPSPQTAAPESLWGRQLAAGLQQMGIALDAAQQRRLLAYLALLQKWNRVFNLTAVRDPAQMVSRQLLDSLSILPWIHGYRVLDVGTGAGLPGIPLAIALPDVAFTLLDANGKKTRFVQQAAAELGLGNVSVVHGRIEALRDAEGFDVITSRAFASLADFLNATLHLLADGGRWLAMKGQAERDAGGLPPGVVTQWHPLRIPGTQGERHVAECRPDRPA